MTSVTTSRSVFQPPIDVGGYPMLEDLGIIGDGATAALLSRDGKVEWMCVPRFDSDPVFASLLDRRSGGYFSISPEAPFQSRHWYEPDTAILVTEMRTASGTMRVTDAMAVRAGADLADGTAADRGELVRSVRVVDGEVRVVVDIRPRGMTSVERAAGGLHIRCDGSSGLHLRSSRPIDALETAHDLAKGDGLDVVMAWGRPRRSPELAAERALADTSEAWRRWMTHCRYDGPHADLVRRAAITLKLCDHWAQGSLVAAPTTSLPAPVGGRRNWDYRYTWIRDASFSVYAMRRIGFDGEAAAFLGWVLDAFERDRVPRIMYTVAGDPVPDESEDSELEGYRGSAPVRWGNAAADQRQHDVYGEVLDCAHMWSAGGAPLDDALWPALRALADRAGTVWREPDRGIWEIRSEGRVFTYSAAMCHVALGRAVRIAERLGLPGPTERWRREASALRDHILERSWDDEHQTLSEHLDGGGEVDSSLLALPLRRVVEADHPRMVATTRAVATRLSAGGGLLYRYLPDRSPDGVGGEEGAFLLCSFWLVDNLAKQGRVDEAADLFESMCARASPLGLLPEQIDPTDGSFVGNFPQAFSHIGLISSAVNLQAAGQ